MTQTQETGRRYLAIYLTDHHAGSTGGLELARRSLSSNEDNEFGAYLRDTLIPEIEEDRSSLEGVMDLLGVTPQSWKDGLAWVGEKVGRMKLNGELKSYSPLSRMVEFEGLTIGVRAKLSGWEALKVAAGPGSELEGVDLDRLMERARRQEQALEEMRQKAAALAFQ